MKALRTIHSLYVGKMSGSTEFGRRLVREIERKQLFEIAGLRSQADAIIETHGEDSEDGFVADVMIRDPQGTPIWSARSVRPHGSSGPMAYERLLARLEAALDRKPVAQPAVHS
jgi:hypothetical protein